MNLNVVSKFTQQVNNLHESIFLLFNTDQINKVFKSKHNFLIKLNELNMLK